MWTPRLAARSRMAKFKDAWLAHQRKRWMRADAHRWFAPNHNNFLPMDEGKAGFNPDQPRDEQGRWTETDADAQADDENAAGQALLDEFGAAERPRGHHFVPRSLYRDLPLSPDARAVFDRATTGTLRTGPHGWSSGHLAYNEAVKELLTKFLDANGISAGMMNADHARAFVDTVRHSNEPRIREYNLRIYRQELRHLLRFGPRRAE